MRDGESRSKALLVELQSSLQDQMLARAKAEDRVRQMERYVREFKEQLRGQFRQQEELEGKLKGVHASLITAVTKKSALEAEVAKLREVRDESERREILLGSRLNDAKKREASRANTAERLKVQCTDLRNELARTKEKLAVAAAGRDKLDRNIYKLKKKCIEKVKLSKNALSEERNCNEEQKRKMKAFVETKAEELWAAKSDNEALHHNMEETRVSLREMRNKCITLGVWESFLVQASP